MRLYLVRHGEARRKADDPARPLTGRGRKDVARVAAFARQAGVEITHIRHSGVLRAVQTAAILAEHLAPPGGLVAMPELAPEGDVQLAAALLDRETRPVMCVGHLPFMEQLVGLLVAGDPARTVAVFQTGAMVCLEPHPASRGWSVVWAVSPDLLA